MTDRVHTMTPKYWRGPTGACMPAEYFGPWASANPLDSRRWYPLFTEYQVNAAVASLRVRVADLEAVHEDASGAILQAVEAERERCAKLCEDEARLWEDDRNGRPATEARLCAARIRAGGPR